MILLIDNYDSFTYNLYQYIGEFTNVVVKRNDEIKIEEIIELAPEAIILSPGPGRPENAGICIEVIQKLHKTFPILGICLGHQAIGAAFGGNIVRAKQIMHGKTSAITHNGQGLFQYLSQPLEVMRYHSLVIEKMSCPTVFDIVAKTLEDGEIMAIKHKRYPLYGLQFHPESIGTKLGKTMLKQFLAELREEHLDESNIRSVSRA